MKVLHILNTNKFSGAENVACTIIKNMEKNYDMIYCSPQGPISEKLREEGIEYYPVDKLSYAQLRKVIGEIKPDVIHAHDYRASCYAALFSNKAKIISHIHCNNSNMRKKNFSSYLYKLLSKYYNKIVWVSNGGLNDYYYRNNVINKSIVLPNVIDKNTIIKKSEAKKIKDKYDLIFVGRVAYPKNPERFVELVHLLIDRNNKINAAIVGDGNKMPIIKEMVKKYKLSNHIAIYGQVSNPYVIMKQAKILMMTSEWEGTPMVALEAQALGKPIISTPVDGLYRIVKNDYNGFLSDDNEELCNKIVEYLKDDIYDKLSGNTIKIFEKENNLEKYIKSINDIYLN